MTRDEKGERLKINGSIRKVSPSCHCASLALLFLDVLKLNHDAKEKTSNNFSSLDLPMRRGMSAI